MFMSLFCSWSTSTCHKLIASVIHVITKGRLSANNFRNSQIRKVVDLNHLLDLGSSENVTLCGLAICGPNLFLRFAHLKLPKVRNTNFFSLQIEHIML